jgi:SAM-dependent methyltransferase
VVGLEISPEICKIALEVTQGAGPLGIELYDGKSFPFKNDTFILIYACEVIEHVSDDSLFLSEIWRILRESGQLILSTPNASKLPFLKEKYPDHVRHYATSELKAKLEESGFSVIANYYRGHFLMSIYDTVIVGLARRFIKKGYFTPSIYTFWRLEEQPLLTRILWQLYRFILNPIVSALITGEFELLKNLEGNNITLVAKKTGLQEERRA